MPSTGTASSRSVRAEARSRTDHRQDGHHDRDNLHCRDGPHGQDGPHGPYGRHSHHITMIIMGAELNMVKLIIVVLGHHVRLGPYDRHS